MRNKILMTLALLLTAVTGAWAQWTGGTYTATTNEELGAITVSADATLTINEGVTVTVSGGINVASGTLTVTGPGTLVVNGKAGSNGGYDIIGGTGGNGGVAISGNIIVQGGATVTATGGNGGNGGNGEFDGGPGGNGGNAFAGTLTYKSGTVTANGGSGGSGGSGTDENASSGSAGKAFANDVDFTQTTGYSVTNGTSTIGSVLNQTKVVISGGTDPNAEPAIEVTPVTGKTNEWTFTMPAYDVEIAPIYAPVAQWAKVEGVDQLPTAIEGIYAESTDAIVKAGTVVEGQGTAMYFATTDAEMTAEKAAKANGWLATLPTAAGYDGAQTVYVWYYIKGADTPQGETATAENTFNDSEICAEPITVNVLSNKYDIQFKAANDNTIEAGKATVKVGDEAAEVKEGKLTGVKMNSKVTVKAKDGYKFRKVEAKKGQKPLI